MNVADKTLILELLNGHLDATKTKLRSSIAVKNRPERAAGAISTSMVSPQMHQNYRRSKIAAIPKYEAEVTEIEATIARITESE